MKIALDAMGGDFGPPNLVAGAVMALRDYKQINKLHGSRLCIPPRSLT
jgi:fatty acid/phospholipid biosynthesis enzyme